MEAIMAHDLEPVASSAVQKNFGFYYDEAISHPVHVARHGEARVVMVPRDEYERLARLDHVALTISELTDEDINAIFNAPVRQECIDLNHLMEDAPAR
jgi:PHD/YefM family antitoxin component YafN of YafNO toxin-antitoxin module